MEALTIAHGEVVDRALRDPLIGGDREAGCVFRSSKIFHDDRAPSPTPFGQTIEARRIAQAWVRFRPWSNSDEGERRVETVIAGQFLAERTAAADGDEFALAQPIYREASGIAVLGVASGGVI